jgi:hypothetical protein
MTTINTETPGAKRRRRRVANPLSIGLVGAPEQCQKLASAMLRISFDRRHSKPTSPTTATDAAIEALRRTSVSAEPSSQRHVYTAESIDDLPKNIRLDHIVLVMLITDHHDETTRIGKLLRQTLDKINDESLITMHRFSIVVLTLTHITRRQVESCLGGRRFKLVPAVVPVFSCCPDNQQGNLRSTARMILQRAKLSTRHGSKHLLATSPLVVGTL